VRTVVQRVLSLGVLILLFFSSTRSLAPARRRADRDAGERVLRGRRPRRVAEVTVKGNTRSKLRTGRTSARLAARYPVLDKMRQKG